MGSGLTPCNPDWGRGRRTHPHARSPTLVYACLTRPSRATRLFCLTATNALANTTPDSQLSNLWGVINITLDSQALTGGECCRAAVDGTCTLIIGTLPGAGRDLRAQCATDNRSAMMATKPTGGIPGGAEAERTVACHTTERQ